MSEQSVASARASVMYYDNVLKKWMPSGTSTGIAKVHIYHHTEKNTFRIVGRKIQDHEVVINSSILRGLKYFQATETFHQWRDSSQINGLNFATHEDAEVFALAMERVLDILSHSSMYMTNHRSSQGQPLYQTIGHSGVNLDDYAEYRGWANSENGDRRSSLEHNHYRSSHAGYASNPVTPNSNPSAPQYGHQRTASAPPQQPSPSVPPPPPPPPPPTAISGSATLPRLHLKSTGDDELPNESSLAQALASAKLKKTPTLKSIESTPPKLGMASMMDEMTRTLARRRAQTDNSAEVDSIGSCDSNKSWTKSGSMGINSRGRDSGGESPQPLRKFDLDSSDSKSQIVVDMQEMEKMKHEIVAEMKVEMNKMKQDIINAIKMELNRR